MSGLPVLVLVPKATKLRLLEEEELDLIKHSVFAGLMKQLPNRSIL